MREIKETFGMHDDAAWWQERGVVWLLFAESLRVIGCDILKGGVWHL
jgi:hypothetical protein